MTLLFKAHQIRGFLRAKDAPQDMIDDIDTLIHTITDRQATIKLPPPPTAADEPTTQQKPTKMVNPDQEAMVEDIRRRAANGETDKEIAVDYGDDSHLVFRLRKKNGIPPGGRRGGSRARPPGEALAPSPTPAAGA